MVATGIFLAIVGFWLILRTVRKDSTGQTLVDRILGATA
jgi:hypothetical protein